MKRKLILIGAAVLLVGVLIMGIGAAQEIDSDYPASVDPFEQVEVEVQSSGSTTVDVFVNHSSDGSIAAQETLSMDSDTKTATLDVEPGDYEVTTEAADDTVIDGTTISVIDDDGIEERDVTVSDQANQSITSDATVSGSVNVSIQTVIEYNGEILSSETNSYDGSGATEILSATYDPPENGTFTVRQEVVNGDSSIVSGVYFDTIESDTGGAVATTDDGFVAGMSSLELAGVLGVVLILLLVLFGGRD